MDRPARLAPPTFPTDDVPVTAPPRVEARAGTTRIVPLMALGGMAGTGALMLWGSGMAARGPYAAILPVMMIVSLLGVVAQFGAGRPGTRLDDQRRGYLADLRRLGEQLHDTARRQRESLLWTHPAPSALWTLTAGPRRWERRVGDSDFGLVRLGVGRQRLARRLVLPPTGPPDDADPVTADALRMFVHRHSTVEDLPVAVALHEVGLLAIGGESEPARALVRAMLCQLAVLHGPDVVAIVAITDRREDWDWLKWLPHNVHPALGGAMVFRTVAEADGVWAALGSRRGGVVVVIADGVDHCGVGGIAGVRVVVVGDAAGPAARLQLSGGRLAAGFGDRLEDLAHPDAMTVAEARLCARRLARYRASRPEPDDVQRWYRETGLSELNSVAPHVWVHSGPADRLRAILGETVDGQPVTLDIKEAADGGHGPHGLCIGATGSGKSELLRTVVLGMAGRHSPEELNLVLVDFKGGATFLGMEGLNHVAAVITNLADEAQLVSRAIDALGGEVQRRQHLLRRADNAVNLAAYRRIRTVAAELPPLPSLFVVVDEFAELLHLHPEFADLFTMIGRVGRSLGVHLLLASQQLDEGRLRGLESHLSYRICLKTSTAAQSRAVLGVADAAELPATPGAALLRTADGRLVRFQGTYLGVPAADTQPPAGPDQPAVRVFTAEPGTPGPVPQDQRTVFDAVVDRLAGIGARAHQIWLPPLAAPPKLAELLIDRGPELSTVLGVVDLPFEQRRAPLRVDLAGAGGNVAVVGAPQSGKSATVRALLTALAAGHEPRRIQFYVLDFGGGSLATVRAYPHVGSVAARQDVELVRRTVAHVVAVLQAREMGCNVDDYGDVFLVVDGWGSIREDFPDLEAVITGVAARGLSFGVHLILTAARWADIRPGLKDQIGTRIELRLGDPMDSDIDRKRAVLVPVGQPGRGITSDGAHFQIACTDGSEVCPVGPWRAPRVRLLPARVDHDSLVNQAGSADHVVLGLGEADLAPVSVDFTRHAHLLILGDRGCGKTSVLRTLCRELVRGAADRPALVFVVDYRRGLLGEAEPGQLDGYAFTDSAVADLLPDLIGLLTRRLPAPGTAVAQLRTRSWWSGPDVFVIVDDHDRMSAAGDAFAPLLGLLPHANDIGLHLVVARRCAGTARAMFDPLLVHLRDSGCMGLLMDGSPEEGPLIGAHRAAAQPPGRGLFVTHTGAQRVQVGWCPP
ncbi:type VII secretion protein EccCa [Mycolicibacterium sp. CBM1]